MKKNAGFSVLLVCLLALGFVFVSCGGDDDNGGGGGDTYFGIGFRMTVTNFNSTFGQSLTDASSLQFLTGNDLADKIDKTSFQRDNTRIDFTSNDEGTGLSISDIEAFIQLKMNEGLPITTAEKTQIINKLKSDGYVVAVKGLGSVVSGQVGVLAAVKE